MSDKISEPLHKYQLPRSRTEMYDTIKFQHHTLFRGSTIILNASPVKAIFLNTFLKIRFVKSIFKTLGFGPRRSNWMDDGLWQVY